jgi:lipopolysaccharide export system protein LptA
VRPSKRLGRAAVAAVFVASCLLAAADVDAQGFQHDTSLPIEITADRLEVVQPDRVATFTGNVDAIQGDLVLRADELRVHYSGGEQAGSAEQAGAIRRIEASGNVFLSSPRETAEGDAGVYDVASNSVTLDGEVVLTRGENVIRGRHLEIDLVSGRARVVGAATAAEGAAPGERVRAIFTPSEDAPEDEGAPEGGDGGEVAPQAPPRPPGAKPSATE